MSAARVAVAAPPPVPTPGAGAPSGRRREPPPPRAALRAARVADAATIDAAELVDASRSHAVTLVTLPDGRAFVVKRVSAEARAAGRSLAAELYAYRLASWRPALAAILPAPVLLDERRQVLALVAAPGDQLLAAHCTQTGFPAAELAAALGRALAALHAATTGVSLPTVAGCGILAIPDTPEADRHLGGPSEAAEAVAREITDDALLAASLRRTQAAVRPSCLIHADVKWDNAVLDPGPPARVLLFDLELSGHGDPAWDVGSALADTASLAVRLHGLAALASDPARWLSPALAALLCAYASHPGAEPSPDFADRIAGCWTARTVHLALECAAAVDDHRHPVVRDLLAAARRLADAGPAVTAAVHAALAAARPRAPADTE